MNSLTSSNLGIEESILNQGYYFQTLLGEVASRQLLTTEEIEKLQYSLLELMTKEVDRYTNGESSSVPIEKAQELLQSITYLIGAYLKKLPGMQTKLEVMKQETMSVLFYRGLDEIERIKKEALDVLHHLQKDYRKPLSIAYHDTLFQGLPEFFHDYNMEFRAHDLPGSIDYPLLIMVEDYLGVELVAEYLLRIKIEDQITRCYSINKINRLLRCFDREAEHLLINICELVLIESLGCILLQKPVEELSISASEMKKLLAYLSDKGKEEVRELLSETITELVKELSLEEDISRYLMSASTELTERLWNCIILGKIQQFFILTDQGEEVHEELYEGVIMEDDKLRELIAQINLLTTPQEKGQLIREQVRSIYDLVLILEQCFYSEEYIWLFSILGEEELNLLRKWILREAGGISAADFEPDKEWQKQLLLLDNKSIKH